MADPYLKGNGTLRNVLDIDDAEELADAEDRLSALRLAQIGVGQGPSITGSCFDDLKAIHWFIFRDVYPWAGTTRAEPFIDGEGRARRSITTNMVTIKARKAFAGPGAIAPRLGALSGVMNAADGFRGMARRDFIIAVADMLTEINDVHPFREGNGRTQRAYIQLVAANAGRVVDFRVITGERMVHASVAADGGDRWAMRRLIRDAASPERVAELRRAQAALKNIGFDWRDRYVGFVEPGREHRARLVGVSGRHFACIEDNRSILIGWKRDLPGGRLRSGDMISFVGRGKPTSFTSAKGYAPGI